LTGKNRVDLVLLPVSEILKTVPRTNDGKDESRVCGAHHDGAIDVPRARCRRPPNSPAPWRCRTQDLPRCRATSAWRTPKRILHAHPPDQRAQLRFDLQPSHGSDFQRQQQRKPALCQRTSVSGWTIVRTFGIDVNQGYSWIKNQRSLFMSRTRPCSQRGR
jgi:hypothetical protein